jgi:DNA helicase-2/ATP-dependent DNA helicase PcrA
VGGSSFYDLDEIRDLNSYLKVIHNPDDSVSLLRVINTPVRGIGKTTLEVVERIALETGLSLWGAIGECVQRGLLPARAQQALKSFRDLIEDARAMAAGTYVERLQETSSVSAEEQRSEAPPDGRGRPSPHGLDEGSSLNDLTEFDPTAFDFGGGEFIPAGNSAPADMQIEAGSIEADASQAAGVIEGFRTPGEAAHTAELLKFLIDRTGYIKILEAEDSPEAYSRIENIRELVNAAMDSKDRGETLDQFLDHAALVSDADAYDARAQITLMTLHAAKGLEFPLVFLCGLEEGLFPHSRTFLNPDDIEEERRLCYVGMTRAMDQLVITRAVYRRRYGTDMPEASIPSRFLDEIPVELVEELGKSRVGRAPSPARSSTSAAGAGSWSWNRDRRAAAPAPHQSGSHYAYEDEDQSAAWNEKAEASRKPAAPKYNSIDNIAEFFASRGKKFNVAKVPVEEPKGRCGFRPGQKVKHPKYGEGTVYHREGEGEEAKITVQFPRFGMKKLVEKYAQLEKG